MEQQLKWKTESPSQSRACSMLTSISPECTEERFRLLTEHLQYMYTNCDVHVCTVIQYKYKFCSYTTAGIMGL